MWVLFVVDVIVNTHSRDLVKYVRYNTYETELECVTKAIELWKNFTENEQGAVCYKEG